MESIVSLLSDFTREIDDINEFLQNTIADSSTISPEIYIEPTVQQAEPTIQAEPQNYPEIHVPEARRTHSFVSKKSTQIKEISTPIIKVDVQKSTRRPHPYTEEDRHLKSKFTLRVDSQLLRDFKDVCHELGVHCNEILTVHMREDVHKHMQRKDINSLKIRGMTNAEIS